MDTKLVKDVMRKGVVTCPEGLSLPEAARMMTEMGVRALVVTDDKCGLCGILAQSDLVNAALHDTGQTDWHTLSVADVMTRSVLTVTPDAQISEAAKTMVQNHIHRIVVVDGDDPCTPVGVLSMGDLVRNMMRD
jgi:CBS domain-containing protein